MSNQIDTAKVDTYRSGLKMMAQQTRSKLIDRVFTSAETGNRISDDFIGAVKARKKKTRNGDTEYVNTPHKRRWLSTDPFYIADLMDWSDALRILNQPGGQYAKAFVAAMNRERDAAILEEAIGTTWIGEKGTEAEVLPDSQKIDAEGTAFYLRKDQRGHDHFGRWPCRRHGRHDDRRLDTQAGRRIPGCDRGQVYRLQQPKSLG